MQEAHKKEVDKEEAAYEKKREGETDMMGFYSGLMTKNSAIGNASEPKPAFKNVMDDKIE